MRPIKLGKATLGPDEPIFVIAEAGVNHNGSVKRALELVEKAKEAGADCVKFQQFSADRLLTKSAPKPAYQLQNTSQDQSQHAMLRELELPLDSVGRIMERCQEFDILFLSTPYDFESVDLLHSIGVQGFKVASAMMTEPPFLAHIARLGLPVLMSTGMCTLGEVEAGVNVVRDGGAAEVVLLQCTTNYPSAVSEANLRSMRTLGDAFDVLVGYSDHTSTHHCALAAAALGAVVYEKHFTLDRSLPGPDHSSSIEPDELATLVSDLRSVQASLGSAVKLPTASEARNASCMRRSIATGSAISAGTVLTGELLTLKRPAAGLAPALWGEVIGKRARVDIPADTLLRMSDIEW